MAVADLFVSEHDLEDAQEIMMAAEVDNILGGSRRAANTYRPGVGERDSSRSPLR